MAHLEDIIAYCDERTCRRTIKDFKGSENGLQIENNGRVTRIGAAVDAGTRPFERSIVAGVDFLICHHGLFWTPPVPFVGPNRKKVKTALDGNLAVYGAHLPLDCHPEIGNNAILADRLGLKKTGSFLNYEGTDIGLITAGPEDGRASLAATLQQLFPDTYQAIEYGSDRPEKVALLTGSGQSAVPHLLENEVDTLVTGELRQHHFNMAQELGLNLYPCGHYHTEVFGVQALAAELAEKFGLPWTFIEEPCPL
jgi:dinuclear metal center YbgI/SA1388 family protein